jgi:hypothetical protein
MEGGASALRITISAITGNVIVCGNHCRFMTLAASDNLYAVGNIQSSLYPGSGQGGTRNPMPVVAADPVTLVAGMAWYNTVDQQFKGYDGTAVIILG